MSYEEIRKIYMDFLTTKIGVTRIYVEITAADPNELYRAKCVLYGKNRKILVEREYELAPEYAKSEEFGNRVEAVQMLAVIEALHLAGITGEKNEG